MSLTFETTHEYYLRDADLHYCSEHECLIVTRDYEDKVLLNGLDHNTMLEFAKKLIAKESVTKELKDDEVKV